MSAKIIVGDCLDVLKTLPDASVDSVVTDPPYGLSFMGKSWDYDVPQKEVWVEVLRVLKPGGHLLSFFGTRTYHRGVVQIEDAGFEIRDQIGWAYGSGFPKSLDVSKAIDKAAGAEREVVRTPMGPTGNKYAKGLGDPRPWMEKAAEAGYHEHDSDEPATAAAAAAWQGWGTALKPAWEPIVVARKPLIGTVAANVMQHGTGAINVEGCRIESEKETGWGGGGSALYEGGLSREGGNARPTLGRWPTNLCHDGSDEVLVCFPDTGKSTGGTAKAGKFKNQYGNFDGDNPGASAGGFGDSGSAARFFYCAKASKRDRNEGLNGFEEKRPDERTTTGMGTFDEKGVAKQANHHPTVKPTDLMRWLVRLVTPPGGFVLDPFCGSGSTGKAAVLEGFNFIGIEREPEYAKIAEARIVAAEAATIPATPRSTPNTGNSPSDEDSAA